jgi:hypothetical protein
MRECNGYGNGQCNDRKIEKAGRLTESNRNIEG